MPGMEIPIGRHGSCVHVRERLECCDWCRIMNHHHGPKLSGCKKKQTRAQGQLGVRNKTSRTISLVSTRQACSLQSFFGPIFHIAVTCNRSPNIGVVRIAQEVVNEWPTVRPESWSRSPGRLQEHSVPNQSPPSPLVDLLRHQGFPTAAGLRSCIDGSDELRDSQSFIIYIPP